MIVEHPKKVPTMMALNLMLHEHQRKSADQGKDDDDELANTRIRLRDLEGCPD